MKGRSSTQKRRGGSKPPPTHQPAQSLLGDFGFGEESTEKDKPYLELVTKPHQQKTFDRIVKVHHSYVPTTRYGGRRINWLVKSKATGQPIGSIGVASAIIAMSARDKWIGWDKDTRLKNLINIANNWRFCLRGGLQKNFASQTLGLLARLAPKEWEEKYGDRLVLLESLVQPPHRGVCYKAAGWRVVGMTKGTEFKWINKSKAEEYVKKGFTIVQRYMKYGDKVDEDKWQVADLLGTTRKYIWIKGLTPDFWRFLNR